MEYLQAIPTPLEFLVKLLPADPLRAPLDEFVLFPDRILKTLVIEAICLEISAQLANNPNIDHSRKTEVAKKLAIQTLWNQLGNGLGTMGRDGREAVRITPHEVWHTMKYVCGWEVDIHTVIRHLESEVRSGELEKLPGTNRVYLYRGFWKTLKPVPDEFPEAWRNRH